MATPKLGSVLKSHKYLDTIKNNTLSPDHPRHHGVYMQAHHVLSEEGIKLSGLGKELERFGYDINTLDNLVFIPSTLQGACHLGVQPHRGNHTSEFDDDDGHPTTYHKLVKKKVLRLEKFLKDDCPGDLGKSSTLLKKKMDNLSKEILDMIEGKPMLAKLTDVASYFVSGNKIGCGGTDSVPHLRLRGRQQCVCPVHHNHHKDNKVKFKDVELSGCGPEQKTENIAFPKNSASYKFKMGK
jgi:hypothetical protein